LQGSRVEPLCFYIELMQKEHMTQTNMFTDEMQIALSKLDAGQVEHFYFMSCALLECYSVKSKRAAVVIHDEIDGETKMITVNADELQISNMLEEVTGLMSAQLSSGAQTPMQLN
jgi:hypothetical protein